MTMEWSPDMTLLRSLVEIIDRAFRMPSPEVNQKMIDTANDLNGRPDGALYLLEIFKLHDIDVIIRNSAGFLIKNRILMDAPHSTAPGIVTATNRLDPEVLSRIAEAVIDGLCHSDELIQDISGSILSALLTTYSASTFTGVLSQIHSNCESTTLSTSIKEASWSAAVKILEDVLDRCVQTMASADVTICQFAQGMFTAANSLCRRASAISHEEYEIIALALKICNKIASSHECVGDNLLDDVSEDYMASLGTCSTILEIHVQIEVLRGIGTLLDFFPKMILDSAHSTNISQYLTDATAHPDYSVRFEATLVWPKISRDHRPHVVKAFVGDNIGRLCCNLLNNFKYADKDYCQMEPSQFAHEDATTPDDLTQIAPQHHYATNRGADGAGFESSDDDDEASGPGGNTWGSDWTLRKGSALSIDNISTIYQNELLPYVLPIIEANLQSTEWETVEAAVLGLGAIGPNCHEGLCSHMPMILSLLLEIARHKVPLVRSISVWCMGRLRYFYQTDGQCLDRVLNTLVELCLDRNKTVQQAAISAIAFVFDAPPECLMERLGGIGNAFSVALDTFQETNLMMLCETTQTLILRMSTFITEDEDMYRYVLKITEKWVNLSLDRPSYTSMCELVAVMLEWLSERYADQCFEPVFLRSAQIIVEQTAIIVNYPTDETHSFPMVRDSVLSYAIEMITSVLLAMKYRAEPEFMKLLSRVPELVAAITTLCQHPNVKRHHPSLRTSVFALIGDFAPLPGAIDVEHAHAIVPELISAVNCHLLTHTEGVIVNYDQTKIATAQNAIWALGEILLVANLAQSLHPRLQVLMTELTRGLTVNFRNVSSIGRTSRDSHAHLSLVINISQVVLRLGKYFPREVGDLIISSNMDVAAILRTIGTTKLEPHYTSCLEGWFNLATQHTQLCQKELRNTVEMIVLTVTGRGNSSGAPMTDEVMLGILGELLNFVVNQHTVALSKAIQACTTPMQDLIKTVLSEEQKQILVQAGC